VQRSWWVRPDVLVYPSIVATFWLIPFAHRKGCPRARI
jgi:hypothetical protein